MGSPSRNQPNRRRPASATRSLPAEVATPTLDRRWVAIGLAVLVGVAVLAGTVWWWQRDRAVAAPSASGPAAATVDGTTVTRSQVDAEVAALVRSGPNQERAGNQQSQLTVPGGKPSPGLVSDTTGQLVLARVVEREFGRRGLQIAAPQRRLVEEELRADYSPAVWTSLPAWLREATIDRRARLDLLSAQAAGIALDNAGLRVAQQAAAARYGTTCVRQVLWGVGDPGAKEKAELGHQLLTQNQVDFATLARDESVDATANRGGDLGCLTPDHLDDLDPAFPPTLAALQPGQFSAPFQTRYGWHVLKVDRRELPPFEQSAPAVYADQVQKAAGPGNKLVGELMGRAAVTVDPAYGRWERQPNGAWWVSPPG